MATAAEIQVRDKIFIGGEWVEPEASGTLEVDQLDNRGGDGIDPGLHARPTPTAPWPRPATPSSPGRRPRARSAPAT